MSTNYIFKLVKNAFVNVVSEVAMESSPGPSTSSGSRAETDLRAQSSAASTPRAGTISILACAVGLLYISTEETVDRLVIHIFFFPNRSSVHSSEGRSVEIYVELFEKSHSGPCIL